MSSTSTKPSACLNLDNNVSLSGAQLRCVMENATTPRPVEPSSSSSTTTDGMAIPIPTTNTTVVISGTGQPEGLSLSDKISLGVGVPTVLISLGAWLCVRQRRTKGKHPKADELSKSKSGSRAGSASD